MGNCFSQDSKEQLATVRQQLEAETTKSGKQDAELKAKEAQLQSSRKEAEDLKNKSQLLENRSADLEKQNQDKISGLQQQNQKDLSGLQQQSEEKLNGLQQQNQEKLRGLEAEQKRSSEAAEQQKRDLEAKISALTCERDQAQKDRDNHELRAKAVEYAHKRQKKELQDARQQNDDTLSQAALTKDREASDQREALEQRSRDLEAKNTSLLSERDLAAGERDKANSERDLHEIRANALVYAHKRETVKAAESAETEKDGLRKAHAALLQYHEHSRQGKEEIAKERDGSRQAHAALLQHYDHSRRGWKAIAEERDASRKAHAALLEYYENTRRDWKQILKDAQLRIEALKLQKQALLRVHDEDTIKAKSAQYEAAAIRNSHQQLAEYTSKHAANKDREIESLTKQQSLLQSAHNNLKQEAACKFSKQEDDFTSTRKQVETLKADHEAAVLRHERAVSDLSLAKQAQDKLAQTHASELEALEQSHASQIQELETQKQQHIQTSAQLSNQLADAKASISKLEGERHDSATAALIDSPQQEATSVFFNEANK